MQYAVIRINDLNYINVKTRYTLPLFLFQRRGGGRPARPAGGGTKPEKRGG